MKQNDHEFKQKLFDLEKSKLSEEISKRSLIEQKIKSQQDFRSKVGQSGVDKLKAASEVKQTLEKSKMEIEQQRQQLLQAAQERKRKLQEEKKQAKGKQADYAKCKIEMARTDIKEEGTMLQKQIVNYEKEARELERMEAELLRKLQETQNSEREAFSKLESAMIDASMPKRNRLNETSRVSIQGAVDGGASVIS